MTVECLMSFDNGTDLTLMVEVTRERSIHDELDYLFDRFGPIRIHIKSMSASRATIERQDSNATP